MDAQVPRTKLTLVAGSIADDLSCVALADAVQALEELREPKQVRLIGGQMVSLLAARWDLGARFYRETKDVDVGIHKLALNDGSVVARLEGRGYEKRAGNRFGRTLDDLDIKVSKRAGEPDLVAMIDLLIPSYTSRIQDSVPAGGIVTTEVPGLAAALQRDPVRLELDVVRLNKAQLSIHVLLPDEASALILKTLAWDIRHKDTDAADIWRCLEVADAAGVQPSAFESDDGQKVRALLGQEFAQAAGAVMKNIRAYYQLSPDETTRRRTRIRALLGRVFGSG